MTNAEWKKAEELLSYHRMVDLLVDGYRVSLVLVREGMKLYIQVYVNGEFKGKWITEDCEERRRFLCKSKRCLVKPSAKKELKLTKKEFEKFKEKYTYYYYSPYFSSFRTLKSQLIKNNKNIQLLEKFKEDNSNGE